MKDASMCMKRQAEIFALSVTNNLNFVWVAGKSKKNMKVVDVARNTPMKCRYCTTETRLEVTIKEGRLASKVPVCPKHLIKVWDKLAKEKQSQGPKGWDFVD
jgi:hypothetical protein